MVQRKENAGNGADDNATVEDAVGAAGNVDKIRDILFGGQMRDYDRRFETLHKQFERDLGRAQSEFDKRVTSFESYTKKELEKLTAKYLQEKKERVEASKQMERLLKEGLKDLEDKLSAMDEYVTTENADLRSEIHDSKKEIVADMKSLFEELTEFTRTGQEALNDVKIDRAELSSMLTEMAMRITRDFTLPGD